MSYFQALAIYLACICFVKVIVAGSFVPQVAAIDPQFFVDEIFEKYGNKNVLTYEGFEHLLENLGLGRLNFEKHHDVSIHKVNGTFLELHDEKDLHYHSHNENEESNSGRRRRRHANFQSPGPREDDKCLSTHDILESYGLMPTHGLVISHANFLRLCPAIVYELDEKHCRPAEIAHRTVASRSRFQVWLEASASILTMSIVGLLCAGIVPILNRTKGGELLQFLMAMATGTLVGDAIIHLLPQVLHQNLLEDENVPLLRGTFTLFSMVLMFVTETFLRVCRIKKDLNEDGPENSAMLKHKHSHNQPGTLACAVIAGDILHNLTDGLSIGAAFSSGQGIGLACAVAVFCHELPHELGDYAVLLKGGMGVKRALLFNLFSSLFSFLGMVVGLILGEMLHAAPWVNSFTAGSFLYISLVHLVPELKKSTALPEVVSQTAGLIAGVALMFFIGLYEDQLEESLSSGMS